MRSNIRLLTIASFLTILLGTFLLWFGIGQTPSVPILLPSPSPVAHSVLETDPAVFGIEGETAWVTKVVDGDTIKISTGWMVRLVGIDTPETVDPRRPIGCFGKEASNQVKSLLSQKEVILQKDVSETDKYQRLLRYVYLPLENGQLLFVNDYLVREGFARAFTYPPDAKFSEQFKLAEEEARKNKRGLWGRC